ncbi:hypothetical protein Tco_0399449 [Tanacetum coccineum]
MQVVQIILRYLDSSCSKLNLEEGMAPVRISSGPEPIMTLDLSSSSLFKPCSSSNDVWKKQFKPRSSSNDVCSKQFRPRSSMSKDA